MARSMSGRAVGLLLAAVTWMGCGDDPARVVAVRGCGLDAGTDSTSVRLRIRGDFAPRRDHQLVLGEGESGTLQTVPDRAGGITVEGLFGDDVVVAVGRTPRIRTNGEMPVYYAPPLAMCPVESGVASRRVGATAVGALGDVLFVGGLDDEDALLTDIVTFEDEAGTAAASPGRISIPSTGQTVHPMGGRRFVIVGGAGAGNVLSSALLVDLDVPAGQDPVGEQPILLNVNGQVQPRAHHAGVVLSDGRALIAGGCAQVNETSACVAPAGDVLGSALYVEQLGAELDLVQAPPLDTPRFGHTMLAGRDDVVLVVGGTNGLNQPATSIERLVPESDRWEVLPFDPGTLPGGAQTLAGAALLEGGTVLLVRSDGSMAWAGPEGGGLLDGFEPLPAAPTRAVSVLPGDRVLVDAFLVPALSVGGGAILDLAQEPGGMPLPTREGSHHARLDDGTVLLAGGLDPDTGAAALPFLLRLRPPLDGPDEDLPRLGAASNFLTNDPREGFVTVEGGVLTLASTGPVETFPSRWIHMRGIRSASFRLEAEVRSNGGRAYVVLLQGSLAAVALALDAGRVAVSSRDATGAVENRTCDGSRGFTGGQLRVDVHGSEVVLSDGEGRVARCVVGLEGPFAAGFAVSGSGTVTVGSVRVART